jgi:hypothetical protein
MNRQKLLVAGGVIAAVLVIVMSGIVFVGNSTPVKNVGPIIVSTPTPSSSVPPGLPTPPIDYGEGSDDDSAESIINFDVQEISGAAGMDAFLTYDTDESFESRSARLAKSFAEPDVVAALTPKIISENHEKFADYSAKIVVRSIDGVAWLSQPTATTDIFIVFVSYTLTEAMPGQDRITQDRGEWQITIDRNAPTKVVALNQ